MPTAARAEGTEETPAAAPKPEPAKDVTRRLAHYLVTARYEDLPANVRKEGVRTLLNWVGVAIGGSRHETVDIAVVGAGAVLRAAAGQRCSAAPSASTS